MAYPSDEDDKTLPWLEPAELDEDDDDGGFPYRGLIVAGIVVVAVVAILWFVAERFGGNQDARNVAIIEEVPLIEATDAPYKVRPDDPGGLDVDTGSLTHSVAEGGSPGSRIAMDDMPEEPVPVAAPPVRRAPVAASSPVTVNDDAAVKRPPTPVARTRVPVEVVKPVRIPPKSEPAAGGSVTIQLGAFGSVATADQVWGKLSGRVPALGSLKKSVPSVETGGKTLYRLRAGGIASVAEAGAICSQVQAAGEQCAVVR